ncbi:hypothetical protein GBA52_024607 [Prunus armeniaca]|nr:hypothetical protein GBA52_024607 [Prunus armeniaca]
MAFPKGPLLDNFAIFVFTSSSYLALWLFLANSPISLQESLSPFNSRLATTLKTGLYISSNSIASYG